jgi:hypothetical protein
VFLFTSKSRVSFRLILLEGDRKKERKTKKAAKKRKNEEIEKKLVAREKENPMDMSKERAIKKIKLAGEKACVPSCSLFSLISLISLFSLLSLLSLLSLFSLFSLFPCSAVLQIMTGSHSVECYFRFQFRKYKVF